MRCTRPHRLSVACSRAQSEISGALLELSTGHRRTSDIFSRQLPLVASFLVCWWPRALLLVGEMAGAPALADAPRLLVVAATMLPPLQGLLLLASLLRVKKIVRPRADS
jgi:hypothetical protein